MKQIFALYPFHPLKILGGACAGPAPETGVRSFEVARLPVTGYWLLLSKFPYMAYTARRLLSSKESTRSCGTPPREENSSEQGKPSLYAVYCLPF
jgi:hypothetical protein